jgi:thioredoxin 1
VGDADFDAAVRASDVPVLVDFWATWCGPCKAQAPMLEDIARDYAGRLKVVKVEMDANPKTALACRVRSAPTLQLFKDGTVQATQVGLVPKSQLLRMIDAAL